MISDDYLLGKSSPAYVKEEMQRRFGMDMALEEESADWEHHGWFMLVFRYQPKAYRIYFEGEFNSFNIRFTKEDGAFAALSQVTDYSHSLNKADICNALEKMQTALKEEINFYKSINGKLYREDKGHYRRVKAGKNQG